MSDTIGAGPSRAARRRSENLLVTNVRAGVAARRPDDLVVEEPMTIQLDGTKVSTTMRTPGNDFELAVGFCHTEGLLAGTPVQGVRYCANGSARSSTWATRCCKSPATTAAMWSCESPMRR